MNRLVISDSNSPDVNSIRFGRWSSPDKTSASSTKRGSTMLKSRTGRTGTSSAGLLDKLADRSSRHASGSIRLKSRSKNTSRVVRRVTRQGRSVRPVAALMVSTCPLNTTVSTSPSRSASNSSCNVRTVT